MADAIDLRALLKQPAVRDMFTKRSGAHQDLGIELVESDEDVALMRLPFRESLTRNLHKRSLHAGVVMTAMDSAMGMATMLSLEELSSLATLELRYDELREPLEEEDVFVEAACDSVDDGIAYLCASATDSAGVFARATARFILTPATSGSFFETALEALAEQHSC